MADLNDIDTSGQVYCYAFDAELAYIQRDFTGLRWRNGKRTDSVTEIMWWGDEAGFLIDNL